MPFLSGPRVSSYLSINIRNFTAHHNSVYSTVHFHASERCPPRLTVRHSLREHPLLLHVNFHIRVGLLWQVEDLARVPMELVDQILQRNWEKDVKNWMASYDCTLNGISTEQCSCEVRWSPALYLWGPGFNFSRSQKPIILMDYFFIFYVVPGKVWDGVKKCLQAPTLA